MDDIVVDALESISGLSYRESDSILPQRMTSPVSPTRRQQFSHREVVATPASLEELKSERPKVRINKLLQEAASQTPSSKNLPTRVNLRFCRSLKSNGFCSESNLGGYSNRIS